MTEEKTTFRFGNKVISKKIGVPAVGEVCGVTGAYHFWLQRNKFPSLYWDSLYPDWKNTLVVTVFFEEAIPYCSKQEVEMAGGNFEEVQKTHYLAYPIEDLEKMDD